MTEKILPFPRGADILPDQTEKDFCYAATSIGILEFYTGRQSTKSQTDLVAWNMHSRIKDLSDQLIFGSVSYILKKFDCYNKRIKIENGTPNQDAIFKLIKSEIDADRPVVIQIKTWHCGIAYGYDDDSERYIYAIDPDGGRPRPTPKYLLNDFLNNYRNMGWDITALFLTKKGNIAGKMALPAQALPGLVEPGYQSRATTLADIDDLMAGLPP